MARDHGRIETDIWADEDFRALTVGAQHLYILLVTSPTLSYCGVADWRPRRLLPMSNGRSLDSLESDRDELIRDLYIAVDEDTEEVLVRSFVRNDGMMKQPNMGVAMAKAFAAVASNEIRGLIVHETIRLYEEEPGLKGWGAESARKMLTMTPIDPATYPLGNPSVKGQPTPSADPCPTPYSLLHTPNSLLPTPYSPQKPAATRPSDYPEAFEEFWAEYPKKKGKRAALKAWEKARERVDHQTLVDATARYRQDPNRVDKYTQDGSTWLNDDGWLNEALPSQQEVPSQQQYTAREQSILNAELLKDNPDPRALAMLGIQQPHQDSSYSQMEIE